MRYRERVTVQVPTQIRSRKGAVTNTWADVDDLTDLPATIVPSVVEQRGAEMIVVQDRYDVVLAGRHPDITPNMGVLDGLGRLYQIEQIDPLLGGRQTRLVARLVDSPAEGS